MLTTLKSLTSAAIESSLEIQNWVEQFADWERPTAKVLLSRLKFVSRDIYSAWLQRVVAELPTGKIHALYSIRKLIKGFPLWNESGDIAGRPGDSLGSEDLVYSLVANLARANPLLLDHCSISILRERKVHDYLLIDDSIGSGDRVASFINAMLSNATFLSWWSFGRIKIHVVSFARPTEAEGKIIAKIKGSDHGKRIFRKSSKIDFTSQIVYETGWLQGRWGEKHDDVVRLCRSQTEIPKKRRLGYGDIMANLIFYHSVPNNIPGIRLQPVSQDILVQSLLTGGREFLTPLGTLKQYERPETYLVDQLIQRDEIDYDPHADLLENLSGQVIAELRRYLANDDEVRNVAMHHRRTLADLIWLQMREHKVEDEVEYIPSIVKAYTVLRAQTLNSGDGQLHPFSQDPPAGVPIRRLVFTGFEKCCFNAQKFDSFEGEFQLARLLERDPDVLKWLKPAQGQFRIIYDGGKNYHPDFVVETHTERFVVELKRADWTEDESVRRKAKAAALWCQHASALVEAKPFSYLLIPHQGFGPQYTFATLRQQYMQKA